MGLELGEVGILWLQGDVQIFGPVSTGGGSLVFPSADSHDAKSWQNQRKPVLGVCMTKKEHGEGRTKIQPLTN